MYRVIRNFSIDNTDYLVGDTISYDHTQRVDNDPHFRKFVVPIAEQLPAPQPVNNN